MNHEENVFYKMIYEVSDYAIIMMDANGTIMNWNVGAQRIKGYASEEVIGSSFKRFYTEKDKTEQKPDQLLATAIHEGSAKDEGWRVKKDGSLFWANVLITAIHGSDGKITGFSKVTRDLTERKNAELAVVEHAKELEKKNKELEQFAYIASHDLQEPLRTITCLNEMLRDTLYEKIDPQTTQMMDYILEATQRMRQLIHGLLDYSRIGKESDLVEVNCAQLINHIKMDLKILIEDTGTYIEFESLPTIWGYELELRQMFTNLITNGIKFRKPGQSPIVRINAKEKNGKWTFSVNDNGIGIPQAFHEKIFVIFQRLHSREVYEGTGIGLAHCHKIAQLHKGDIWVDSKEGEGSTFYFSVDPKKLKSA
ncbi:MAG: hypothetical protein RLZZ500_2125 [Bacteroidota bacterium]